MSATAILSKQRQLEEYGKCLEDPKYAIESYLQTFDQTQGGFVPLKLFPRQKEVIDNYQKYRYNILNKYRQSGISTITAAYSATEMAFASPENPPKVLILANKQDIAFEMLKKIRDFLQQWPSWVGVKIVTNAKGHLVLNNKAEAKAVATSKDALRGFTPTLLIIDEAAFVDGGEEIWAACQAALSTGGKATLISCVTANTYIFTSEGIKQISDFVRPGDKGGYVINQYRVLGKDGLREGSLFYNNGTCDTLKLKTRFAELEGSFEHKLWAYSSEKKEYGWYRHKELKTGDYLSIQTGMNVWGNNNSLDDFRPGKITPEIAYSIGSRLIEVDQLLPAAGSEEQDKVLEHLGFNLWLEAPEKYIPSRLMSMSRENIIHLIRGMVDNKGLVNKGRVSISHCSKRLIERLRVLLLNFGILSLYNEKEIKNAGACSKMYRLDLDAFESRKYFSEIGFGPDGNEGPKQILESKDLARHNPHDIIPQGREIVQELLAKYKISLRTLKAETGLRLKRQNHPDKARAEEIGRGWFLKFYEYAEKLLSEEDKAFIGKFLSDKLRWTPITEITLGRAETFDFSLPDKENDPWCHSVVYNGILGHQTPCGLDALFYRNFDGAINNTNNFHPSVLWWYEDPRYAKGLSWVKEDREIVTSDPNVYSELMKDGYKPTSPWFKAMCAQLNHNERMIAQELECSFLGSGGNVVKEEYIKEHVRKYVQDPSYKTGSDNNIWVWDEPNEGSQYIMGVDVASGMSDDYGTFSIIDFNTGYQAVEYQGKIQPDLLADMVFEWGSRYQAYTVVDITGGYGLTVVLRLLDNNYKFLHYDENHSPLLKNHPRVKQLTRDDSRLPGFTISNNRTKVVSDFEWAIREEVFKMRSSRLISELKTFVYKKGERPDHLDGFHDDLIFASAMALHVGQHAFAYMKKYDAMTRKILDLWGGPVEKKTEQPQQPAPKTGFSSRPQPKPSEQPQQRRVDPNNPYSQFGWLFGPSKR